MLDFDLNLLAHLAALVETGSVTGAARRVGISQPAMSRSLSRLRVLLGDPLLVRTRGGMILTRRAEELAVPLRAWLIQAESFVATPAFEASATDRRFRLIAGDYGLRTVVAAALPAIRAAAPGAAIDVLPPGEDDLARLASGEADLLLTDCEPDPRLVHERLVAEEPWRSLGRKGHPLAGTRPCLATLITWPHLGVSGDPVARAMTAHGLERNLTGTVPYATAAADLIAGSDLLMLLPAGAAAEAAAGDPRLAAFEASDSLEPFRLWLAWHNRAHRDPGVQWLIGQLDGCAQAEPILLAAE